MSILKASWEQPSQKHPSRHRQSHTCVTHDPASPATGCVFGRGMEEAWPAPTGAQMGTDGHIELLWHCHPLSAHPNLRMSPQPCRADQWKQPTCKLLPQGCSSPASNPSHSFFLSLPSSQSNLQIHVLK